MKTRILKMNITKRSEQAPNSHFYFQSQPVQTLLPAKLNGLSVQSLLDTGASESFVNEDDAIMAKSKICEGLLESQWLLTN